MTYVEQIEELRKEVKQIYSPSVRIIMNSLMTSAFLADVDSVNDAVLSLKELEEVYKRDFDKPVTSYKAHQVMADSKFIKFKIQLFKKLFIGYLEEDLDFKKSKDKECKKIIELLSKFDD